jgi:replication fork protection complex subunit Tof1/Swi1
LKALLLDTFPGEAFLSSLLNDIKAERARITEKDNLRLLFVAKWFLEFYTALRVKENPERRETGKWGFDFVAEVMEREWLSWVLRRMREAVDNKVRAYPR